MNSKRKYKSASWKGVAYLNLLAVLLVFLSACSSPEGEVTPDETNQAFDSATVSDQTNNEVNSGMSEINVPSGYMIRAEDDGDLDGDGVSEKVVIFDTDRTGEMGIEREVRVYSQEDGFWSLWHQFIGPVLASEHGGMMGDPFEKLEVHDQRIYINHFGGSADKWHYTHEFEFNGESWQVAAATLVYFQNCAYSETYTYDFNEHTCFYSKQIEACNDDGMVVDKSMEDSEIIDIDPAMAPPTMDDFTPGGTALELDGKKDTYYL